MNFSSDMQCAVSHTEMDSMAKNMTTCTQQAALLQDGAIQQALMRDLRLVVIRKESACTTPAEAERRAINEYNNLRSQGVKVNLFKF
jgi:hypothetical protein